MNSDLPSPGSPIDRELLETLFLNQERLYPWNPLTLEAEPYFSEIENSMGTHAPDLVNYLDEGCNQFYLNLDQLWESVKPLTVSELNAQLEAKFSQMVPQEVLATIAAKVEQLTASSASIADRLIYCVQESLPQWDMDDLLVLARPFAYAMRGGEEKTALDRVVQRASTLDWESSSELEKARLTLAVARYAIAYRDRNEVE
ncbi:hypothetical protein PJF56_21105 [Roseofilum sp. BLCC_M91]|uniref:Uncharacterized protein n=1 Tax=Roseofilum halophilum BLCC-M91 TaxID=3022259 RepID=A0ABT7BQ98_9CYAN|nr:hypothetical protein [Roseofilum halophilum]MDJ1181366.1 hypothetical protein [Roseofilum halophilum BLCC-M91]